MNTFKLPIDTLLRYVKIRFIVIGILVVVGVVVVPYWLPIMPDFEPTYSMYSDAEYGHSNLLPEMSDYQLQRESDGSNDLYASSDLIVITKPQLEFDDEYISNIVEAYFSGSKLLIIGSEGLEELLRAFSIYIPSDPTGGNRIFDEVNNGGDLVYPQLSAFGLTEIYGVVPTYIQSSNANEVIQTFPTAEISSCFNADVNFCSASYQIGFVNERFGYIADEWMFRNEYTDQFSQNIDLFGEIVNSLLGGEGTILFEESYLEWAPLNAEGVENFIAIRLNALLILTFITILGLLFPLIIGLQAKVFNKDEENRPSESFDNLERRLDFVHIEKLPSAPLNLLEKTLMDDRLKYEIRGKFYFQYAAHKAIEYIHENDLLQEFPSSIYEQLEALSTQLYPEIPSWRVLELSYQKLLSIQTQ